MNWRIKLTIGRTVGEAELNDSSTARAIYEALPIEGTIHRWGDEIYFKIPLAKELDSDATAEMKVGQMGYWPTGQAFCIFFGPTPLSVDDEPRAASPVNPIGFIKEAPGHLSAIRQGEKIRLEKRVE